MKNQPLREFQQGILDGLRDSKSDTNPSSTDDNADVQSVGGRADHVEPMDKAQDSQEGSR